MKEQLAQRGSAASYPDPLRHAPNAALLIDFDNVTMGIRSDLQEQLRKLLDTELFKGKISVQRAYADWRRYPQYIVPLSEASIDLIFAPAFGSNKKNATDIRLAIDALELVFTRPEIGTYVLLSGDSDFSSLVLKLKEYGKYVIGVGIRESSSDLLVQNCDEYYGYSELTGLLREGEGEHRRRDPWELVVEATMRMRQGDDVMRSDRLKQMMQELDPNFDEKDAGFSKYSKFVVEAGRRGLLKLNKMDNGQYEVDLGPNANVSVDVATPEAEKAEPAEARARRRRPEREKERSRPRGRAPSGMVLGAAFDLLRQVLTELGAVGDESADANQVLERMVELAEDGDDPILERNRFQRMLRQAHDAGVIDLAKTADDIYLLKLRPPPEGEEKEDPEAKDGRRAKGTRRAPRGRRARGGSEPKQGDKDEATDQASKKTAEAAPAAKTTRRNPRFRRGARKGGVPEPAPEVGVVPGPEEPVKSEPADAPPARKVRANRSVRGRRGGRSRSAAPAASAEPGPTPGPVDESGSVSTTTPSTPGDAEVEADQKPTRRRKTAKKTTAKKTTAKKTAAKKATAKKTAAKKPTARKTGTRKPTTRERTPRTPVEPAAGVPAPEPPPAETNPVAPPPTAEPAAPVRPVSEPPPPPAPGPAGASEPDATGGLFKRMSAALQRAMLGPQDKDQRDEE